MQDCAEGRAGVPDGGDAGGPSGVSDTAVVGVGVEALSRGTVGEQRGAIAAIYTMAARAASGAGPPAHSRLALVGARHRLVESDQGE